MATYNPAANNVFNAFAMATESLARDVYRLATIQGVWTNLIPRGMYPQGTGVVQTTYTINYLEPQTDDETWSNITASSVNTGVGASGCAVSYEEVGVGFDATVYNPEIYGLKGITVCKDDLKYDWQIEKFLGAYVEELAKRAKRTYEKRLESVYMQLCTKVVVTGNAVSASSYTITDGISKPYYQPGLSTAGLLNGANQTIPGGLVKNTISRLNQDILDDLALELIYRGATQPDSGGFISMSEDGPSFSLYIHPKTSKKIIQEATNTGVRTDLQWLQSSELMKRLGATRALRNFRHVPNMYPPRFGLIQQNNCATTNTSTTITAVGGAGTFANAAVGMAVIGTGIPASTVIVSIAADAGSAVISNAATATSASVSIQFGGVFNAIPANAGVGQLERVPTWVKGNGTKGDKYSINPNWISAPIEATFILSPWVFTAEVVQPVNSAAGLSWNPMSSLGEWQWVTGGEKIGTNNLPDPFGKLGAHFCEFHHAPRPIFPKHGMVIFHLR